VRVERQGQPPRKEEIGREMEGRGREGKQKDDKRPYASQ
jgi:hypothetical protein